MEAAADRLLSGISDSWTDYEKVKAVYDRVILQTDYQEGQNDQSMYHVITKGEGVCAGYARTVQYLLNRLGIFCTFVSGTAEGGLCLEFGPADGDYYYLDPTWGTRFFPAKQKPRKTLSITAISASRRRSCFEPISPTANGNSRCVPPPRAIIL